VYVSFDDGGHWQALQQNLPRTSVRDLQVHGDDVVIATHGRGFWIMDDVALLRSLADDSSGATRLFPPAVAYRVRSTGFTGTPMPKDEPMASNPPLGAYIDYVLDASSVGPVVLTISDPHGGVVRTFSSDEKTSPPDLTRIDVAPEWIVTPAPLSTGVGAHRFVWDLHYAQAQPALVPEDPTEEENGAWAPPGRYEIELKTGGRSYRQSLNLDPDPRVKLPASAYREQFALSRDVERARVEIAGALKEVDTIHGAIADRAGKAGGAISAALVEADRQLIAIADIPPPKSSPDSLGAAPKTVSGLRYLGGAFHDLARAVDRADTAPTRDAREGYTRDRALLDHVLADWDQFKARTLPKLNTQLQSAGIEPISPQATGTARP
jgi:hypothetical protein